MPLVYPHNLGWWLVVVAAIGLILLGMVRTLQAFALFRRHQRSLATATPWPRVALKAGLRTVALLGIGVALLGPYWGERILPPEPVLGRDLFVVLDVSRSMLCEDVYPNRLERARQDLLALADDLERRGGWRIGLIAFADRAALLCPLTTDFPHFREALKEADLEALRLRPDVLASDRGTNLTAALQRVLRALPKSHEPGASSWDVLLVCDGGDTLDEAAHWTAEELARRGVRCLTVGVGDPNRSSPIPVRGKDGALAWLSHEGEVVRVQLEAEPLREIARATSGAYIAAETEPMPTRAVVDLLETQPLRPKDASQSSRLPIHRYWWFVVPALLALLVEARLPVFRRNPEQGTNGPAASGPRWLVGVVRPMLNGTPHRNQEAGRRILSS